MAATRSVQLQATLLDTSTPPNPLANKTVSFEHKLSTDTSFTSDGTATTNAAGQASVTVTLAVPDTYDATASFAGDTDYDPSQGSATGFRVKAGSQTQVVLIPG